MGFVQGTSKTATSVTSTALAFSSAVKAGNLLVAATQEPNTTAETCADNINAGNYSVSDNHSTGNTSNDAALFYKENTGAGTPTVTVSSIGAGAFGLAIGEYDGPLASASLDVHGATDANGTSITSGSLTPTGANGDLLIACGGQATQNVTLSNSTSGWAVNVTNSPNTTMDVILCSRVEIPAAAFTTAITESGSAQDMTILVAAFKLASASVYVPGRAKPLAW